MARQNNFRVGLFMLIVFSHLLINVYGKNYTIKTEYGDIIECVNIHEQPAFRNPLLKNHTIQMRPSSSPPILTEIKEGLYPLPLNNYRNCPDGTVPITRTDSFKHHKNSSNIRINGSSKFKHEYAKAFIQSGGPYYGASARLNVWNPATFDGETSVSQIWVQSGDYKDLNTIEAGWQVKAGDNKPRLFIYWTRDNYKSTGCYNLECPGFVQIHNKIGAGSPIITISSFKGRQYYIELIIHKDRRTGNWWLRLGNEEIGYWPSAIFTSLKESANTITWGGEIENSEKNKRHTSTQMGSGHYPGLGFGQAAFNFNLQYIDGSGQLKEPNQLQTMVTNPNCYDLKVQPKGQSGFGVHFYFGGPGFGHSCL